MRFVLGLILSLLFFEQTLFAYYSGNELVNVPSAVMQDAGYVEYGGRFGYFMKNNSEGKLRVPEWDSYAFVRLALSSRLEYGVSIYDGFRLSHHLQGMLLKLESKDKQSGVYVATGFKHIESQDTTSIVSNPVYRWYAVSSIKDASLHSRYHLGLGSDKSAAGSGSGGAVVVDTVFIFAGIETDFSFGTVMVEWDGRATNIGLRIPFGSQLKQNVYVSYTPHPEERTNFYKEYGSVGFSFSENVYDWIATKWVNKPQYDSDYQALALRLSVLESKQNAISDVLSNDFQRTFASSSSADAQAEVSLSQSVLKQMQSGLNAYYKKDFKAALSAYQKVVSLLPNSSVGYVRLGSIYYQLGDFQNAISNWEKAVQLDPLQPKLIKALEELRVKLNSVSPTSSVPLGVR